MSAATFPFGVQSGAGETTSDPRGPDTMNRVLLHAARHHERRDVFLDWEKGRKGWGWIGTPDWRADRATIRVALLLNQRLEVGRGEPVALWLPLSREFAWIERACWSVGAVSVPVWPEWSLERAAGALAEARPGVLFAPDPGALEALRVTGRLPDSVRAAVVMRDATGETDDSLPYDRFMEYGGVLDTPERASMWRSAAAEMRPGRPLSWEYVESGERRELDDEAFLRLTRGLLERFPARQGRVWALTETDPDPLLRAAVYAAWADGLTRVAFAASEGARARLSEVRPSLVLGPGDLAEELAGPLGSALREEATTTGATAARGLLGRLFASARNGGESNGMARGGDGAAGGAPPAADLYYVATDRSEVDPDLARRVRELRFVARAEFGVPTGTPGS